MGGFKKHSVSTQVVRGFYYCLLITVLCVNHQGIFAQGNLRNQETRIYTPELGGSPDNSERERNTDLDVSLSSSGSENQIKAGSSDTEPASEEIIILTKSSTTEGSWLGQGTVIGSNNSSDYYSGAHHMTTDNVGNIWIAFEHNFAFIGHQHSNNKVVVYRSTNKGADFQEAFVISNQNVHYYKPSIAYADGNIFVSFIRSNGSAGIYKYNISSNSGSYLNVGFPTSRMERVRIISDAKDFSESWIYVAYLQKQSLSSNCNLYFTKSTDLGATWDAHTNLANVTPSYQTVDVGIDMSQASGMFISYLGTGSNSNKVMMLKSTDFGNSWSSPTVVFNNTRDKLGPVLAVSGESILGVYQYSHPDGDDCIRGIRSTDRGASWTEFDIAGSLDDERFPWVSHDGSGNFYVTYQKNSFIYARVAQGPNVSFATETQISSSNNGSNEDYTSVAGIYNFSGAVAGFSLFNNTRNNYYIAKNAYIISTPTPSITVSPTLLAFDEVNINMYSIPQSYTLTCSNLSANVSVSAPNGFHISTNQTYGYSNSLTLSHSNGSINQTIWVRFGPTSTISYGGNISHSSSGAISRNVSVSGIGINTQTYTLSLNSNPIHGGTVSGGGEYKEGTTVTITASEYDGYRFVNWTGDTDFLANTDAANTTVTMPAEDISLTANFGNVDPGNGFPEEGVTDVDGNFYPTVILGNQEWISKNLRTTKYNNETNISTGLDNTNWQNTTQGAFSIYPHITEDGIDSETQMVSAYGKLYNWYAVADERGLCPSGWRVPSDTDWEQLINFAGGSNSAGKKLKSCRQVNSPLGGECQTSEHPRWSSGWGAYGTDEYGFSLPFQEACVIYMAPIILLA
jgi:uncharacterized protein (TIGR02145 family)/uncharacterized repeat protein (TIGR02543 family)